MRQEKYNKTETNDDIKYAFDYNSLGGRLDDIDVIVAEVCGENDGYPWYWILQMKDGTFSAATGWCDYTGWDCQSGADIIDGFKTPQEAIDSLSLSEESGRPNVKACLEKQVAGTLPFAIYTD
jgi:hypothetical protein